MYKHNLVCNVKGHQYLNAEIIHLEGATNWHSNCPACGASFIWIYAKTKTGYWKQLEDTSQKI